MLWTVSIGRKERKIDVGLFGGGKLLFSFFGFILNSLHRSGIILNINARLIFETVTKEVDNNVIKILATKVGVAVSGFNLENAIAKFKDRNIESTTTKVEDDDLFFILFLKPIGKGSCSWFVNNTFYFKSSNFSSILSRLTLGVIKVGRNGDDGFCYFFTEKSFSISFDL